MASIHAMNKRQMTPPSKKRQKAFSLIEIMVVVIILALLISFALPNFMGMREDAEAAKARKDADTIANAALEFYTRNGKPPTDVRDLNLSKIPVTPSGNPFNIQDPYVTYEHPKGKVFSIPFRSIGKLLFVDTTGIIRISTALESKGVETMKQLASGCQARFSPNGTMICAIDSGNKLVVYDISGLDLTKPNASDIEVISPKFNSGKTPAWLSDTTVVFTAKISTNTPPDLIFYVYSFDVDSPNAPPTKLFEIGAIQPVYLDAAVSGIVGLHDGTNIDIFDISGNVINQIRADSSGFTFSRDGSRIAFQKSGAIHICTIDETSPASTGFSGKNPCFSPDALMVAYENSSDVGYLRQKRGTWEQIKIFDSTSIDALLLAKNVGSPFWSR